MKTFLITLCIFEIIWIIIILAFGFSEAYLTYKKPKKNVLKLNQYLSMVILNAEFVSVWFVGAIIVICAAVPATWFILIFNFIEKLIYNL